MNKSELLLEIDEILELDTGTLTGNEVLEDLEDWDSLAVITYIALIDEKLDHVLEGEQLVECETVNDLIALVADQLTA